ncbi:DUF3973 domain-containing protein [Paenibacillus allorhizosphaerae]|uniref:DUF3973 domain-containing protein n=1 Tax=Paenibacillus allorhizosphaerae TaxID=2849866 RepID=A0ABN7TR37_9BACL|nr:hypothetical protein PAECIP111802_05183 [Paenibacillus allorhizosphaerae]
MYYCLCCEKVHKPTNLKNEVIFTSGFRFSNDSVYNVGICQYSDRLTQMTPMKKL